MRYLKIEAIITSLLLIVIASVVYNLGLASMLFSNTLQLSNRYLYTLAVSMPLGFIVIPNIISKKYHLFDYSSVKFDFRTSVILAGAILLLDIIYFRTVSPVSQLIIATCEEYLFRYVILQILEKYMPIYQSAIINSLLFALVLHLNYSFIDNLLFRFPLSIFLYVLAKKYGLRYAVSAHWLYNLLVSKFMF